MKLIKGEVSTYSVCLFGAGNPACFARYQLPKKPKYYQILTLPIPDGVILEAGALRHARWSACRRTRIGDIYMIEGASGESARRR
jgi:hypothetical protein